MGRCTSMQKRHAPTMIREAPIMIGFEVHLGLESRVWKDGREIVYTQAQLYVFSRKVYID